MGYIDNSDTSQQPQSSFQRQIDALARSSRGDDRTVAALATIALENGRLTFNNDRRDLPPEIARAASFVIPLALNVRDGREVNEKTVSGCEGGACQLQTVREGADNAR